MGDAVPRTVVFWIGDKPIGSLGLIALAGILMRNTLVLMDSTVGLHFSDLLSLLGIEGTHWWGRCGHGADSSVLACTLFNLAWNETNSSPKR